MKPTNADQAGLQLVPIKIIFAVCDLYFLWIYFFNTIFLSIVEGHPELQQLLKFKDFCFVFISS